MRRILSLALLLLFVSFTALAQNFTDPASPLQPGQDVWLRANNVNFRLGMPAGQSGADEYYCTMDNPPLDQVRCPVFEVAQDGVRTQIPNVPAGNYSIYLDRLGRYAAGYAYQPVVVATAPIAQTCTVTDFRTGQVVTQPSLGQDLVITCTGLGDALPAGDQRYKLILVFNPSGISVRPFQFELDRDRAFFRVPPGTEGSVSATLYRLGWGNWTINFTPPIARTAPVLISEGHASILTNTTFDPIIRNGAINLPRVTLLLTFKADNVGFGGTAIFNFVRRDGSVGQAIGTLFPRSSGLADPLAQVEVTFGELTEVVGVYVTDPNDPSVPPSNTLPLTVVPSR